MVVHDRPLFQSETPTEESNPGGAAQAWARQPAEQMLARSLVLASGSVAGRSITACFLGVVEPVPPLAVAAAPADDGDAAGFCFFAFSALSMVAATVSSTT